MGKTNIEWTDISLNPFVGCSKCSPGCQSCYAERFASRLAKNPKTASKYADVVDDKGRWTGKISDLDLFCFDKIPKKPCRVFVGSMTDIFHENVPYEYQIKIMDKMKQYPQHTFLLLTKRIARAQSQYIDFSHFNNFPNNIWLGVTVCNQEEADKKIPILLQIPAAKRFISVEPMLSGIDIRQYLKGENKLDWVICGGETGKNARPIHERWVKSLRDQCLETGTPYFFKSWGEWVSYHSREFQREMICKNIDGCTMAKIGKKLSGHFIDGVKYRQFPES